MTTTPAQPQPKAASSTRRDVNAASTTNRSPAQFPPQWASTGRIMLITGSVFLGPWLVWGTRIAQAHGTLSSHLPLGLAIWSIWPLLTLALLATGGTAAVRDLWSRMLRWRVPARAHLLALLVPPAIAAATVSIARLTGTTVDLGGMLSARGAAVYLLYGIGLWLLTEEAAWRGALLPRLQTRLSPVTASLVLGLVWTIWHVPSLHVPGEADRGISLPAFALLVVATTVLITALVNAAGGSVLIAALFHASFDASYAFTGVVGGAPALLWVAATLTALAAAGVTVRTRGGLYALAA